MIGTYDNDENIMFTKQYINQHSVDYNGQFTKKGENEFEIKGKWRIGFCSDNFVIEGSSTSHDLDFLLH